MKMTGKPAFYWDACVLLAWLQDEQRPDPTDMEGAARVQGAFDRGEVILTTSVITLLEVLPSGLATPESAAKYKSVFRPDRLDLQGVTRPIIELARTIRDETRMMGLGKTISTPDAIHLATAIVSGVAEFHTFDGSGTKKKSKTLIPLSRQEVVQRLVICRPDVAPPPSPPPPPQPSLFPEP